MKPPNIFLDSHSNVKVGDFGLATKHRHVVLEEGDYDEPSPTQEKRSSVVVPEDSDDYSEITTGVGTAFYRAPEQEREGYHYDQKADMFSLGM